MHGVNTQAQLAEAEGILQARLRRAALDAGVTMVAPDTVHLSADTKLSRDVIIEPYVVFGPGVVVEGRQDPLVLASGRRAGWTGRDGWSVRALASGYAARCAGANW